MSEAKVELCPETGICSIIKGGNKVDLMPDEVETVRGSGDKGEALKSAIAVWNESLAAELDHADVEAISARLGN